MSDTELRQAFIAGVEWAQRDLSPSMHLHLPTIESQAAAQYPGTGDTAPWEPEIDAAEEARLRQIAADGQRKQDTAALDDLLDAYAICVVREGRAAAEHGDARSAIHDRLATLVQAEREACAKLCESYHTGIAQVVVKEIRARSTPTPPTMEPAAILQRVEKLWSLSMQGQAASIEDTHFLAFTLRTALATTQLWNDNAFAYKLGMKRALTDLKDAIQESRDFREQLEVALADTRRVDWIEAQTNGTLWQARQSTTGRGFRLHNSSLGFSSARYAIDGAIGDELLAGDAAMAATPKEKKP